MLTDLIAQAFTAGGALAFAAGIITTFIWQHSKCWWMHHRGKWPASRHPRFNTVWLGILLSIVAFAWITFKSNTTQSIAEETAREVQACQEEFNEALTARSNLSTENDRLSLAQREAIIEWVHGLVLPPPEVAQFPWGSPERDSYIRDRTIRLDAFFRVSQEEQRRNDAERAQNPLPEPTCGKKG